MTIDYDHDPYADVHEAAQRIVGEYVISEREAFDLILGFGSETAALQALRQRWWNGQVELLSEATAE